MDVQDALAMARELLAEHGLHDWTVGLDRARTRAGVCRADRRWIGLSGPLTALHDEAEVRDTVLHEIAHALVGPGHGHDAVWRATARRLGCSGERTSAGPRAPGPWAGTCPAGHTTTRHRRPTRVLSCGRCGPGFDPANVVSWRLRGREVPPAEMPDSYRADLRRLQDVAASTAGRTAAPAGVRRLPVGSWVRVVGGGPYTGTTGQVVKLGRTRYHVRTRAGVLTVPFALAEAGR
ncbi:SprT-like domain-containing protein [Kineococcus rhizosphaerae]|uniref:SprT-like family protein n=1 Tax=Kineococcus rhizosphaerae TaxID=559628 RepID=A0A2T0QYY4_9ACTN|nr:SprT-like domain-containing protein [Kineococcus rhizosphaerae]PRY11740.1 SprT-like family protein [Kineococcus rhizosphaerae]